MIIDASALVAIVLVEPERAAFIRAIDDSPRCKVSAASLLEACIAIRREAGETGILALYRYLGDTPIEIMPFTESQAHLAFDAWQRFGKTSGSQARLNILDCVTYALARQTVEPLLFKGDDFPHTDLPLAAV